MSDGFVKRPTPLVAHMLAADGAAVVVGGAAVDDVEVVDDVVVVVVVVISVKGGQVASLKNVTHI